MNKKIKAKHQSLKEEIPNEKVNLTHITLGEDYVSYDNYKEFGRMLNAFNDMWDIVRSISYRIFSINELLYLSDFKTWLENIVLGYESGTNDYIVTFRDIKDETRHDSPVDKCCQTVLKLIMYSLMICEAIPTETYRESYYELFNFCIWQWNQLNTTKK